VTRGAEGWADADGGADRDAEEEEVSIGGRDEVEDGAPLVFVEVGVSPDVLVEVVAPSALKDHACSGSDVELGAVRDPEAAEGKRRPDGMAGATGGGERDLSTMSSSLLLFFHSGGE
jgi:hypothetical protein